MRPYVKCQYFEYTHTQTDREREREREREEDYIDLKTMWACIPIHIYIIHIIHT